MADSDNVDHFAKFKDHLNNAQTHLNNASDMMDRIESMMPTVTGGNPLPRPRPKSAPSGDIPLSSLPGVYPSRD
jgi:hypothetical protein